MKTVKLKYQASAFLDADSIMPNTRDVTGLIQAFKDSNLLPFLAQENSTPRMGFRSLDNEIRLLLLSKRFIYEKISFPPFEKDIGDIEAFCKEAKLKFENTLSYFQRKCYRMSLVQEMVVFDIPKPQLDNIAKRLLNMPTIFSDNLPFEWDWRCTSSIKRVIGSCQEDTNTIAVINKRMGTIVKTKTEGEAEEDSSVVAEEDSSVVAEEDSSVEEQALDSLKVTFDINTLHLNTTVRFGSEELEIFLKESPNWHHALRNEVFDFMFEEEK